MEGQERQDAYSHDSHRQHTQQSEFLGPGPVGKMNRQREQTQREDQIGREVPAIHHPKRPQAQTQGNRRYDGPNPAAVSQPDHQIQAQPDHHQGEGDHHHVGVEVGEQEGEEGELGDVERYV